MFPRTNPAFAAHFEWHKRMKAYFATPTLDAISKHLKRERDLMARAVAELNLKDPTR